MEPTDYSFYKESITEFLARDFQSYNDFVDWFEEIFPKILISVEERANFIFESSEDVITSCVSMALIRTGLIIEQDSNSRGHVDLKVKLRNGWSILIEAKIFTGPTWVFKGLLQLLHRYSSPKPEFNNFGIVLSYVKKRNLIKQQKSLVSLIEEVFLDNGNIYPNIFERLGLDDINDTIEDNSIFNTKHIHDNGCNYRVSHIPVNLFHVPTDPLLGKKKN